MPRYIALLRGINVGGHKKVPMADLRICLSDAGYDDVVTYIQSGNVALSAASCEAKELSALIERRFGFAVPVIVRTGDELVAAIAANPFPEVEDEPKLLHAFFSAEEIPPNALDGFDAARYLPDRLAATGSEIYVAYAEGAGVSKLTNAVLERSLGLTLTARNWSTVLKLDEMANSG